MNIGVFPFVLAIVAMSLAAGIVNNYLRNQRLSAKKTELNETNTRLERVEARLRDLTERMQTVEAIVTDQDFSLKREIESL